MRKRYERKYKNIEDKIIPSYKCKVCGMKNIKNSYDICHYCGCEDDDIQNEQSDYMGGANHMTYNQQIRFWTEYKDKIMNSKNDFFVRKFSKTK